jgi:transcriptional regulator of acetoin/glycerol metabolism
MAEGGQIDPGDLPPQLAESRAAVDPVDAALADLPFADARERAMDAWERRFLAAALERHGGNVSATARALDLHRQSLQKRLRALGLAREAPGGVPGAPGE